MPSLTSVTCFNRELSLNKEKIGIVNEHKARHNQILNIVTTNFVDSIATQPYECERQHTLISVHAQTAVWQ